MVSKPLAVNEPILVADHKWLGHLFVIICKVLNENLKFTNYLIVDYSSSKRTFNKLQDLKMVDKYFTVDRTKLLTGLQVLAEPILLTDYSCL